MRYRRRLFVLVSIAMLVAVLSAPPRADADASNALVQALAAIGNLGPQSFSSVVQWARNGAPQVPIPIYDYQLVEAQILNLGGNDRGAVLSWLQGNGRSALYGRGATDDQIGPPRYGVDFGVIPSPSPTPNAWRDLQLASPTLNSGPPASSIVVINGFAAARRDGTSALACVSFKNTATIAATRVVFEFPLLSANGDTVATLTLDRRGTFSPNTGIMSYPTLDAQLNAGFVNKSYADNCVQISNGVAAVPILSARRATYQVTRVEYADSSVWPAPAPSPTAKP